MLFDLQPDNPGMALLSPTESAQLQELESVIQAGMQTFVDVGNALLSIRDSRLYRQEFGTFEDYCRERWGFTGEYARLTMRAAEVVTNLRETPTIVGVLPATESQARPLVKLEPEQQREAWQRAVETAPNGKVTAAHVQNVVNEYSAPKSLGHATVAPIERAPVLPIEPILPITVRLHNADSRHLDRLTIEPAHLVITSPPYNVGIDYATHDDTMDADEYEDMLLEVFGQCNRVMVDGARVAVVVPFGVGRNPWRPFAPSIMRILEIAGFTLRGQIIWDKGNSGNRTSWGSFRLPSDPSLRDTTEAIVVAHKGSGKLPIPDTAKTVDAKGTHTEALRSSEYFMQLAQDHWVVAPESASRVGHPAPFPIELARRLIDFYAYPGAHILDPFAGSGTTGVAAMQAGCYATLVELSATYCDIAARRIANV